MITGVVLGSLCRKNRFRLIPGFIAVLGVVLIWFSSTPMPLWAFWGLVTLTVVWSLILLISRTKQRTKLTCSLAVCGLCIGLVVSEIPHKKLARLPQASCDRLYVVGDSLSAGFEPGKLNWPAILQKQCDTEIVNLAQPGATLSSALKQAERVSGRPCVVLLEIGGNDLLRNTDEREFRGDLETLLRALNKPGQTIVMFELPLLPGQAGLGQIQRALAKAHAVPLIPKRGFTRVLSGTGATIDGLHLSESGAADMAELVKSAIGDLLVK